MLKLDHLMVATTTSPGWNVLTSCCTRSGEAQSSEDQIFAVPRLMISSSGIEPTSRMHVRVEEFVTTRRSAKVPPYWRRVTFAEVDSIATVTPSSVSAHSPEGRGAVDAELGGTDGARLGDVDGDGKPDGGSLDGPGGGV